MMNVKSPKKLEFIVNPVATTNVLKLEWFQNGKILKMNTTNLVMKWKMEERSVEFVEVLHQKIKIMEEYPAAPARHSLGGANLKLDVLLIMMNAR